MPKAMTTSLPRLRCARRRWRRCGYSPPMGRPVCRRGGPWWWPKVAFGEVIAAYVDNSDAEPAVLPAVEAIDAADLGDEDADFIVGDAQDHDLAWYAAQELPFLLELL